MAKKIVSINIDEETIKELDALAKKMGVSRSQFVEMTLKTAVGGQSLGGFYKWMFKKETEKEELEKGVLVGG